MSNNSIRPEDILPDGTDSAMINGTTVRKGTIAAFLANIDILESPTATDTEKQDAIDTMTELAPAVVTIGLPKHVTFKNPQAENIILNAKLHTGDNYMKTE